MSFESVMLSDHLILCLPLLLLPSIFLESSAKLGFPLRTVFYSRGLHPLISQLVSASCMGLAISLCFCFLFPLLIEK